MIIKTKAIVISSLKYQEKSLIVKCFTESDGLKSYFVPNAFSGNKNKTKAVFFQPLTQLEIIASHRNKGSLEHFREIKVNYLYQTIPINIIKSSIVIFLAEVLHSAIREEEKNTALFEYLETSLQWLDTHHQISDFHLSTLIGITRYLGFYPAKEQDIEPYFEMINGVFSSNPGINTLNEKESQLLKKLLKLKRNQEPAFLVSERQLLLKIIMDYYTLHLDGFRRPKSVEILKEVFE